MSSYLDEHEDAVLDGLSEFMNDIDRDLRRLSDDVDRDVRDMGQILFSGGARV
jgi:archaellum component FlaC